MKWPVLFCTYAYDSMLFCSLSMWTALQLEVMKSIHGSMLCMDTQHPTVAFPHIECLQTYLSLWCLWLCIIFIIHKDLKRLWFA